MHRRNGRSACGGLAISFWDLMPRKSSKATKVKAGQGEAASAKQTEGEKEDLDRLTRYRRWRRRVTTAQDARKAWEEKFHVKTLEEFFLGDQWEENTPEEARLVLNHFAASIDTDLPNLFYQDPKWFVRPTPRSTPNVELRARVAEATLETVARQDQSLKQAGGLAVLQAYFRLGCIEAIYDPQFVKNPEAGQPVWQMGADGEPMRYPMMLPQAQAQTAQGMPGPMGALGGMPGTDMSSMLGGPMGMPQPQPQPIPHPMGGEKIPLLKDGQPQLQPKEYMSDDAFRFEWVDAALLLLDDEMGPDRSKWRWVGKEVLMPLEDAKDDPKFNDNKTQLQATEFRKKKGDQPASGKHFPEAKESDEGYVRLFVCYDIYERKTRILADAQSFEDFLFEDDSTPGLEDHPLALLSYIPILGPDPSAWPKPPTADWLQPQEDYNKARFLIREHAERNLPKEVYDDTTFPDEEEIVKYTKGAVGVLAKVQNTAKPPVPVAKPGLNEALVRIVPLLQQEWRIITGQTGARLAAPEGGTATEASFVERSGNLRDLKKQDAINDWLSLAGWKMLKLLRKNMTFNMWVKLRGLTNKDVDQWLSTRGLQPAIVKTVPGVYDLIVQLLGNEKWDEVSQEALDFDAEVLVVPGSARARNLEVERKQWVDFLGVLGAAPQLMMSPALVRATMEKFETVDENLIDEVVALAKQMLQAKTQVAGHAGAGDNGGNAGQAQPGGAGMIAPILASVLSGTQATAGRAA